MRAKKAFTLVELLVVISIIAILLAVLMPALSKVREQGRLIVCRTNEKTLVLAASLWAQDHEDWAIAGDWFKTAADSDKVDSSLEKYTNARIGQTQTTLCCPSAANIKFPTTSSSRFAPPDGSRTITYGANGNITLNMSPWNEGSPGTAGPKTYAKGSGDWNKLTGWDGVINVYWDAHGVTKVTAIRSPSITAYFVDSQYYTAFSWTMDPSTTLEAFLARSAADYQNIALWHGSKNPLKIYGKGNIGWVDGHVSIEPADFKSKVRDNCTPDTHPRWMYYWWEH